MPTSGSEYSMNRRNDWTDRASHRLSRRSVLKSTGGLAVGAALLAACGDSNGGGQTPGPVTQAQDTSKEAKRGGTFLVSRAGEAFTFDPHVGLAGAIGSLPFSRLIKVKPGYLKAEGWNFEGDIFESWEFSPDQLTLTGKVRPDFRWHNIAPVNGRQIDAEDVVFSMQRYESIGQNRANFFAKANPDAPIETVTAVDSRTVRIKLKQVVSGVIGLLATSAGGMQFVPKEAGSGFDPRNVCLGSGRWMLAENVGSVSLTFKRHEGHYDAQRMYMDARREAIIPAYATGLAQFQAGALHYYPARLADVLHLKKQVPDLDMYVTDPPFNHAIFKWGWNPALGPGTPFRDIRLRQAFAMGIDRELVMDTLYDVSKVKAEGIDLKTYFYSAVQTSPGGVFGGEKAYWLDPRHKDFGANAKYYRYNIEEAKKLVSAAAGAGGVSFTAHYASQYGDDYRRSVEMFLGFGQDLGFRIKQDDTPLNSEFRPKYADPQGDYDGVAFRSRPPGGIFDSVEIAFLEFTPHPGIAYSGFFPAGGVWKQGDPRYTILLKKARQEFDAERRRGLMYDFQRMEAEDQYQPSFVGTAEQLALYWPAVRNVNVFHDDALPFISGLGLWLDTTRPPLGAG